MVKVGRPRKYQTVAELEKIVKAYFRECNPHIITEKYIHTERINNENVQEIRTRKRITEQQPYTMAGLALRLGLSRQALMEYKNNDEFGDTIKEARAVVEEFNERLLLSGKYATGAIFNLKVNFGYRETPEENPPPENPIVFMNMVPVPPDEQN